MPIPTTADYERRRLALNLAAQTSRGDDCETDVVSRAKDYLAFLEGRDDDTIIVGGLTFGPDVALSGADVEAIADAVAKRMGR